MYTCESPDGVFCYFVLPTADEELETVKKNKKIDEEHKTVDEGGKDDEREKERSTLVNSEGTQEEGAKMDEDDKKDVAADEAPSGKEGEGE